ncbi:MAG: nuclear transport factor 2 family protein [Bacteroidota bacterium]
MNDHRKMNRLLAALALSIEVVQVVTAQQSNIKEQAIALAQAQLDAYNARDIDAFLEPYSDSVKIYNFPHQLSFSSKEDMRPRYGNMFEQLTDLHCELVNRTAIGNVVIDHERVTRRKGQPKVEVFAIYHIRHGKIQEVHFVRPEKQ